MQSKEVVRILLRIAFIALTSLVIVYVGGGLAFIRKPIPMIYLLFWVMWWAITMAGRQQGTTTKYHRQSLVVLVSSILSFPALALAPEWEYVTFSGPLPRDSWPSWIGLFLFAVGIALQAWSMWQLRGYFTVRLGVQLQQKLVTSGPYSIVRHPGYFSYLLSIIGIGLALSSLITLGLAVLVVIFLVWRIETEEQMLIEAFGDSYLEYRKRTKCLVPLIY